MSVRKSRAVPLTPAKWLRGNGVDLAPLTGQDARALNAIAACWECYAAADDPGRRFVIIAVRTLLGCMQPKCRELTKKLIARSLDWSDVDRLWPQVEPASDETWAERARFVGQG